MKCRFSFRWLVGGRGYVAVVARYRLLPTTEQAAVLTEQCRHARYVWNLAVEQQQYWRPGRRAPGYNEQCLQLTSARAEYDWLAAGSQTVQQQALRDFAQAMRNFSAALPAGQRGAKPECMRGSGRSGSKHNTSNV